MNRRAVFTPEVLVVTLGLIVGCLGMILVMHGCPSYGQTTPAAKTPTQTQALTQAQQDKLLIAYQDAMLKQAAANQGAQELQDSIAAFNRLREETLKQYPKGSDIRVDPRARTVTLVPPQPKDVPKSEPKPK